MEVDEKDKKEDDIIAGMDTWVVQPTLRPLLRTRERQTELNTDNSVPVGDAYRLLSIKLTITCQETAVGVSWHHTLGLFCALCFIR